MQKVFILTSNQRAVKISQIAKTFLKYVNKKAT